MRLGEPFGIMCHTNGAVKPYWERSGDSEPVTSPPTDEPNKYGEMVNSVLNFDQLLLDDIGNYSCRAGDLVKIFQLKFIGMVSNEMHNLVPECLIRVGSNYI